jgi:hypothetical protein
MRNSKLLQITNFKKNQSCHFLNFTYFMVLVLMLSMVWQNNAVKN